MILQKQVLVLLTSFDTAIAIIRMFQCNWFEIVGAQMGVSPTRIYVIGSISAQPLNLPNPIILQSYTKTRFIARPSFINNSWF